MLFGISVGLGELLYYGSEFAEMNQVIATMLVIFAIGFVADRLVFQRLEDSVRSKPRIDEPIHKLDSVHLT